MSLEPMHGSAGTSAGAQSLGNVKVPPRQVRGQLDRVAELTNRFEPVLDLLCDKLHPVITNVQPLEPVEHQTQLQKAEHSLVPMAYEIKTIYDVLSGIMDRINGIIERIEL